MNKIIDGWDGFITDETGVKEVTDLTDADYGFGNKLVAYLSGFHISTDSKRDANAKAFFARPASEQVFHGSYSDPKAFLTELRRTAKGRKQEQDKAATDKPKQININALPAVYFHRDLNFRIADGDAYPPIKNCGEFYDENGNTKGLIDKIYMSVTYNVYVLAWELASLGRITNAISSQIITSTPAFPYKTKLNCYTTKDENGKEVTECPVEILHGEIVVPRVIEWADASLDPSEDRLLVATTQLETIVEVLQVRGVDKTAVKWTVFDGEARYC